MTIFGRGLASRGTAIDGLTIFSLPVHGDARGYFKENWQRATMLAAGLPDFGPVQHNIAVNDAAGVTRGVHAEPWDKLVSVAAGRVFGAWVDLRPGDGFGAVVTAEIDAGTAVYVPRGVGNAYQVLEAGTAYSYLVNAHWSADAAYVAVNLADPALAIDWPIPLAEALLSEKDRTAPMLASVAPMGPRRIVVLGADGQLGRALAAEYAGSEHVTLMTRSAVDLAALAGDGGHGEADATASGAVINKVSGAVINGSPWADCGAVINAAAYTAVDAAEADAARAWATNAAGVAGLARICRERGATLVHVSTDYVFDGSLDRPYVEDDPVAPLSVYGQSKAAGELAAVGAGRYYVLRTSWLIGDGANFVATMARLAADGAAPAVVDDQVGRLTFAADVARAARFLLESAAPHGTYHATGGGEPASWFEVAREVFALVGADPGRVRPVSTAEYNAGRSGPIAPRPAFSVLDTDKLARAGFEMPDWRASLRDYLAQAAPRSA